MNGLHARHGMLAFALVGGLFAATRTFAQAVDLPPNLTPFPAANISLVGDPFTGTSTLRFSTTSWNNGAGPMELVGGAVDPVTGGQMVYQRVYLSDGTSFLHYAGTFEYHPEHFHIHFDDYAEYSLQPVDAPNGTVLTGKKVSFCLMDTSKIDTRLPGAPRQPVYSTCSYQAQGISVGWGDTYGSQLEGQDLDFTGAPDGIYQLKIEVDPTGALIESNKNDNVSCVLLNLHKPSTVSVLDFSGNCSTAVSITPNSARIGTTVQVTIAGYGFKPGMTVSFENGSGVRPVASNVQLVSDTDTLDLITATVTVPNKKQGGRDPVWDVRVGSGGALLNAFTVKP